MSVASLGGVEGVGHGAAMPKRKPESTRIGRPPVLKSGSRRTSIVIEKDMYAALRKFQFEHGLGNISETIRFIVDQRLSRKK